MGGAILEETQIMTNSVTDSYIDGLFDSINRFVEQIDAAKVSITQAGAVQLNIIILKKSNCLRKFKITSNTDLFTPEMIGGHVFCTANEHGMKNGDIVGEIVSIVDSKTAYLRDMSTSIIESGSYELNIWHGTYWRTHVVRELLLGVGVSSKGVVYHLFVNRFGGIHNEKAEYNLSGNIEVVDHQVKYKIHDRAKELLNQIRNGLITKEEYKQICTENVDNILFEPSFGAW